MHGYICMYSYYLLNELNELELIDLELNYLIEIYFI